jgi:hypothetical protein
VVRGGGNGHEDAQRERGGDSRHDVRTMARAGRRPRSAVETPHSLATAQSTALPLPGDTQRR